MSKTRADEIAQLRDEIRYHDRKYYVEAAPRSATSSTTG